MTVWPWSELGRWSAAPAVIPTISVTATPASVLVNEDVAISYTETNAETVNLSANLTGSFSGNVFTPSVPGSLIITATATSSTGDTASDTAQVTVSLPTVDESTLTVTFTNMSTGSYMTTVQNLTTAETYYHSMKQFQGGTATFEGLSTPPGTRCEVIARAVNSNARGIQEGDTV